MKKGTTVRPKNAIKFSNKLTSTREGTIVEIRGDIASVKFTVPRTPDKCDKCGFLGILSVNHSSGQVECLRSGCGHEHGFEEVTKEIPLDQLIDTTGEKRQQKQFEKKKEKLVTSLKGKLKTFTEKGLTRNDILEALQE
jgi:hypothetical protein